MEVLMPHCLHVSQVLTAKTEVCKFLPTSRRKIQGRIGAYYFSDYTLTGLDFEASSISQFTEHDCKGTFDI